MTLHRAGRVPIHPEAFSRLSPRRPRQRSNDHLKFIRSLPCAICGSRNHVQAAHIRMPNLVYGKRQTGAGEKPSDKFATPLCADHHAEQHTGGEAEFWKRHGLDPFFIACALYANSGDEDAAADVITLARSRT
jgi:hypothetical protein